MLAALFVSDCGGGTSAPKAVATALAPWAGAALSEVLGGYPLVFAVLACAMTATNVSAQVIPDVAKRVGVGGSVGGIFPIDDDVSAGLAGGVSFGAVWTRMK